MKAAKKGFMFSFKTYVIMSRTQMIADLFVLKGDTKGPGECI